MTSPARVPGMRGSLTTAAWAGCAVAGVGNGEGDEQAVEHFGRRIGEPLEDRWLILARAGEDCRYGRCARRGSACMLRFVSKIRQ